MQYQSHSVVLHPRYLQPTLQGYQYVNIPCTSFHTYETPTLDKARSETITVRTIEEARHVLKILKHYPNHPFACDTEVADIDLKTEGPVGNGKVTCISIYGGPNVEFQEGARGDTLWIETIDHSGERNGVIKEFAEWFANPETKTIWHNYGFDKHVLRNEGE